MMRRGVIGTTAAGLCAMLLVGAMAASADDRGASITIIAPNGGEVWEAGSTQQILWDASFGDHVRIDLLKGGEFCETIGVAYSYEEQYDWTICEFAGDAADYAIRIVSMSDWDPAEDISDAPFTITGSASHGLDVTSPDGGEVWTAGTTRTITWAAANPTGYVDVWLCVAGVPDTFLGHVPTEAGELTWDICPFVGDGSDYTVRLRSFDYCGPAEEELSAAPFTITGSTPLPVLDITGTGDGTWTADTVQTIEWASVNPAGDVEIWLRNDESRWDYLGSAPMAAGVFDWHILPCIGDEDHAGLVLRWSACGREVEAATDTTFNIVGSAEPELSVTSPVDDVEWTAGTQQTISWTASCSVGDVIVELLKDEACYAFIGGAAVTDGSLTWDIPPALGDGSYQVRVSLGSCLAEAVGSLVIVGSATPSLTLTSPVGGETWVAGQPYEITWESENLTGYVDIFVPNDLWHHSGHAVVPVSAGSFTWPIAPTLTWPLDPEASPVSHGGVWLVYGDGGEVVRATGGLFEITPTVTPPGDFDGDNDVDLPDVSALQVCYTGRWTMPLDPVSDSFDFEPDGDIDIDDWATAAAELSGPQQQEGR
jgi:hypothetical protein